MSQPTLGGIAGRRLLQSIVEVARHVYAAAASSVFMVSPETDELVFAAVAGEGEKSLVGRRFPAATGLAGWVRRDLTRAGSLTFASGGRTTSCGGPG